MRFPPRFIIFGNQCHADEDEDHQNQRQTGTQMPVAAFGEFLLNDVADQKDLAAAKEVGDYEGCQCRNKYHGDAADDAWKAQRQPHIDQRLKEVGSQVMGCIDGIVVDLAEYVVDREYHKGQEVVNHAEYNGSRCIDQGLGRQMQGM